MTATSQPVPDPLIEQVNDRRRGCQERKDANAIAATRADRNGRWIGGSAVALAIIAVAAETKNGLRSPGAWAALLAALLAVADIYLRLPEIGELRARAFNRYAQAERRIAAMLAQMHAATPIEQLALLARATEEADAADKDAPLVSPGLLDEARARINAMNARSPRQQAASAAQAASADSWRIAAIDRYQRVIDLLIGLSVGAIVLPPLFLKTYLGVTDQPLLIFLDWRAYGSAACFALGVVLGVGFHLVSAALVRRIAGVPGRLTSDQIERALLGLMLGMMVIFLAGLAFFFAFIAHT